jgi:uncharacterized repeat protein (TIGR03803 family)
MADENYYYCAPLCGSVLKLRPGGAPWTSTVLYQFCGFYVLCPPPHIGFPYSGLAIDSSGAIYGSGGQLFRLTPPPGGGTPWNLAVIDAGGANDGFVFDRSGALYATDYGSVFKLTPPPGGGTPWITLYAFKGGSDGTSANGGLIMDSTGALYGSTLQGGATGNGTVFKLTPPPGGGTSWVEGGSDGAYPQASLLADRSGNLYGTTAGAEPRERAPYSS